MEPGILDGSHLAVLVRPHILRFGMTADEPEQAQQNRDSNQTRDDVH